MLKALTLIMWTFFLQWLECMDRLPPFLKPPQNVLWSLDHKASSPRWPFCDSAYWRPICRLWMRGWGGVGLGARCSIICISGRACDRLYLHAVSQSYVFVFECIITCTVKPFVLWGVKGPPRGCRVDGDLCLFVCCRMMKARQHYITVRILPRSA